MAPLCLVWGDTQGIGISKLRRAIHRQKVEQKEGEEGGGAEKMEDRKKGN